MPHVESSTPRLLKQTSYLSSAMAIPLLSDMGSDIAPITIAGFLYFDQPLDVHAVRSAIAERLLRLPRFAEVLGEDKAKKIGFYPISPSEVDMQYHVTDVDQGGRIWNSSDVNEFVSSMMSGENRLDPKRPLWRFYYIGRVSGRSLLVACVDHTIGDGVALVSALLSMLDGAGQEQKPAVRKQPPAISPLSKLCAAVAGCAHAFFDPVLPGDKPNPLKLKDHRNPGTRGSLAQSEPVAMETIQEIKASLSGATVNDVLLAVMTMMLQRYHAAKGVEVTNFRGIFPINMRDPSIDPSAAMGNNFGQGKFTFPLDEPSPVKVLAMVKAQLDWIKLLPTPLIERAILGKIIPSLTSSEKGRRQAIDLMLDAYGKCTAMLSNVAGPPGPAFFCGQEIQSISFYAMAPLGLYVGLLSYNGTVATSICCNQEVETDAARIAEHWKPAAEELLAAVRGGQQKYGADAEKASVHAAAAA